MKLFRKIKKQLQKIYKKFNSMSKRKQMAIAIAVVVLYATIRVIINLPEILEEQTTDPVLSPTHEESISDGVSININTELADIPEYKEITDENTGETVIAEVQVNEQIEHKSTKPPEKPKAEGTYKNPESPPEYKQEQTTIEQKPKKNTSSSGTVQNQTTSTGKVYIDGFGYVDKVGETKTKTGVSDGDINKMVGSMD